MCAGAHVAAKWHCHSVFLLFLVRRRRFVFLSDLTGEKACVWTSPPPPAFRLHISCENVYFFITLSHSAEESSTPVHQLLKRSLRRWIDLQSFQSLYLLLYFPVSFRHIACSTPNAISYRVRSTFFRRSPLSLCLLVSFQRQSTLLQRRKRFLLWYLLSLALRTVCSAQLIECFRQQSTFTFICVLFMLFSVSLFLIHVANSLPLSSSLLMAFRVTLPLWKSFAYLRIIDRSERRFVRKIVHSNTCQTIFTFQGVSAISFFFFFSN